VLSDGLSVLTGIDEGPISLLSVLGKKNPAPPPGPRGRRVMGGLGEARSRIVDVARYILPPGSLEVRGS